MRSRIGVTALTMGVVLLAGASAWASPRDCARHVRRCGKTATAIHILSSLDYSQAPSSWSDAVSAEVSYDRGNRTLFGVRLTFAVVSDATGRTIITFPGVSNVFDSCDLVASLDATGETETLVGQGVLPGDHACPINAVQFPAHSASLRVTFPGNKRYARSVGTASLG